MTNEKEIIKSHIKIINEILSLRNKVKSLDGDNILDKNKSKLEEVEIDSDRGLNFSKISDQVAVKENEIELVKHSLNSLMDNPTLNLEVWRNDYSQLSNELLNKILKDFNLKLQKI